MQKRLPDLNVVDQKPASAERIFFGSTISLEDDAGEVVTYRIVGPDEFDRQEHYISVDSPLARSLMKQEQGEEVEVEVPGGKLRYLITEISY